MTKSLEILTLPPGTEINMGLTEDSDSVVVHVATDVMVVGPKLPGALPVQFVDGPLANGHVYYYHQPEPRVK